MAGRLISLSEEFFADFTAQTADMQFSGDNREARNRLGTLRGKGFPADWADLARWPVQCDCGHTAEFAVGWYLTRLRCPKCKASYWSADFYVRMAAKKVLKNRLAMLLEVTEGGSAMGENEALALRGISRMVGGDNTSVEAAAEDLELTARYRRPR